ncbi:MAG TPA: hypothetical protein VKI19_02515 [Acidimicrobiales bacterium]|nr:hypothetical protein [Acidimicrobiales bacterium]
MGQGTQRGRRTGIRSVLALAVAGTAAAGCSSGAARHAASSTTAAGTAGSDCGAFEFPARGFFQPGRTDGAVIDRPKCHLTPQNFTWLGDPQHPWTLTIQASPEVFVSPRSGGTNALIVGLFTGAQNEPYFFSQVAATGTPPDWTQPAGTTGWEEVNSVQATFDNGKTVTLDRGAGQDDFETAVPSGATKLTGLTVNWGPNYGNPSITWPAGS